MLSPTKIDSNVKRWVFQKAWAQSGMRRPIYLGFYSMSRKTKRLPIIVVPGCDAHSFRHPSRTNSSGGESLNIPKCLFTYCRGSFYPSISSWFTTFQKCICFTLYLFRNLSPFCLCLILSVLLSFPPLSVSVPLPFPLLLISVILQLCRAGPRLSCERR